MMNELRNCLQNLLLYYPFKNLTPSSGKYLSAQQGSRLYSSTAQYSDKKIQKTTIKSNLIAKGEKSLKDVQ